MARVGSPHKLFFVETPVPEENCFVIPPDKSLAARYVRNSTGYDGDCETFYVRDIDSQWLENYLLDYPDADKSRVWYLYEYAFRELDIGHTIIDGNDIFFYGTKEFHKQGDLNYASDFITNAKGVPHKIIIRSIIDLLEILKRDAPENWIYRGQGSCLWLLKASIHRRDNCTAANTTERMLLTEFKRKSRLYLDREPCSDREWLILGQHYGLPTRLLDWSENPLVALYFSCEKMLSAVPCNGIVYAYRHGRPYIDPYNNDDPFAIKYIEVIRPPHLDRRVIAQQSLFTAEPCAGDVAVESSEVLYGNVSAKAKESILNELNLLGISRSHLFPSLASVAADLAALFQLGLVK